MFQFCKHQEQDTLKDLFNQDDDHQELGNYYVKASYKEPVSTCFCFFFQMFTLTLFTSLGPSRTRDIIFVLRSQRLEARVSLLQSAVDEFYKAKNEFAAKATEEEMRLLRFQRKLEEEKGEPLVGFSLQDTITALLSVGLHKHAEQLYKDFRVPDKRLKRFIPCAFN